VILSNFFEGAKSSWPWLRATLVKRLLPEEVQIASVDLQRFVGLYQQQKRTGGAPLRKGGGKSAALSPEGTEARPIEVAVDQNGLHVDLGQFGARSFLPRSTTEFFEEDNPASLLTFTLDEQGQVVAMSLSGGKVLISSAVKLP
jgi:hypothetical protein